MDSQWEALLFVRIDRNFYNPLFVYDEILKIPE